MKTLLHATALAGLLCSPAYAMGPIEKACLKAGRAGTSRELCGCIQDVANATLTRTEVRRAAKFFNDPHMAQELRQSDRRSDEAFWERYKLFGETAETYCGAGES